MNEGPPGASVGFGRGSVVTAVAAVALVAAICLACTSSPPVGSATPVGSDGRSAADPTPTSTVAGESLAARMAAIVAGRGSGDTLPDPLPPAVDAAMADGEIDFDELLAAARGTVACLRERGIEATDPVPSPGGRFVDYSWSVITPPGADREARRVQAQADHDRCFATHEVLIAEAWVRQTTLSEEERQTRIADIVACLEREGVDLPDDASEPEVFGSVTPDSATPARLACLSLHSEELTVPDDGQGS